ncbi:MAG: outer membrane beta-barrel family protein, partial [Bacteroidales bacterium]|nr:outer membrane beta-barrel family protein [Bacteroidales bacterium]
MISIDGDENVRLNGEGNFKVLVNGRSSGILARNFKEAIKAMPASSVKSIEVITNPPVKYDAEGIGGIINIITNRKTIDGYSGSVNVGTNSLGGYNVGGYISAQMGKLAISSNLFTGKSVSNKNRSLIESENFLSEEFRNSVTEALFNSVNNFTNGSIEASYEIDSLNLITLSGSGYLGSQESNGSSLFNAFNSSGIATRRYRNTSLSEYGYGSLTGTLSYQKTYKKPDQNLTLSYTLDYNPVKTDVNNSIDPELNYISYAQHSVNDAYAREHTIQADYYDPLTKKHQIETGVKYILRQNTSETKIERRDDSGQWQEDPSRVNDLDYNQHIGSFYGGYAFKHKTMTAKAGVRMEYTYNDGLSKSFLEDTHFTNEQFDVVPYINLSYMIKGGNMLSAGYTQRLSRPGIWHLNPYVNDSDPMNIYYGNPDLESVIRNTFTLGYRKASQVWNLSLNLTGSFTRNNIEQIRRVNDLGISISTYENIGRNNNVRMNVNFSYRAGQRVTLNINGAAAYTKVSSEDLNLVNDGLTFNGGLSGTANLWKGGIFNFNAFLYGGDITLQSKMPLMVFSSFGLSQRFLKDKLTLSVGVREPFNEKKVIKYNSYDTTYSLRARNEITMRSIQVGLFWRFGNFNPIVKRARRSATDDKMSGNSPAATTANP